MKKNEKCNQGASIFYTIVITRSITKDNYYSGTKLRSNGSKIVG